MPVGILFARYRAVEVTAFATWAGTLPLLIFAPGLPADIADAHFGVAADRSARPGGRFRS